MAELSESQRSLAVLIAQGKSNSEIAAALGVKKSTIRVKISRLYDLLGLNLDRRGILAQLLMK
jgi:DNA-binding NarL/FixJ family response regulator